MAIICNGILDGFSGKVGTVVGADWKNRKVLKAKPRFKRNRKASDEQKQQRMKMQQAMRFSKGLRIALNKLLPTSDARAYTAAVLSKLAGSEFLGEYPNLSIDYAKVSKAESAIPLVIGTTLTVVNDQLQFTWTAYAGSAGNPDDVVVVLVYNPTYNFMDYSSDHTRKDAQATVASGAVSGDELHAWLFCISASGSLTSDLQYAGKVTIP